MNREERKMNAVMCRKMYNIPTVEVSFLQSANMMHYTGPGSLPAHMAPPRRTEVF